MEEAGFDFVADIPQEKLATEAKNSRHKREVCRYWLENRCMKADDCEFLHMFDHDKMPECQRGKLCNDPACKFKHTPDAAKEECANYRLGFCPFGVKCRYRHVTQPAEALPAVSELWLSTYYAEERARKKLADPGIAFRVAMCDGYVRTGWCEFFDMCSYAHGEEQLKRGVKRGRGYMDPPREPFMKRARMGEGFSEAPRPAPQIASAPVAAGGVEDLSGLLAQRASRVGAAGSLPDNMPNCVYFIVRTLSAEPLALSLKRSAWLAPVRHRDTLQAQLAAGSTVFLFFSIVDSQHFQGVARVSGEPGAGTDSIGSPAVVIPITWLRTCALPFASTIGLRNAAAGLDYVARAGDFQAVHVSAGKALMLLMYKTPELSVDVSAIDGTAAFDTFDAVENTEHAGRLSAEELGEEFRGGPPPAAAAPAVPTAAPMAAAPSPLPPAVVMERTGMPPAGGLTSAQRYGAAAATAARAQATTSILKLSDVAPGDPAEPWIGDLLESRLPRHLFEQRPERIAADALVRMQSGFLFACNNVTAEIVQRIGIFGAGENMQDDLLRVVQPGTPVLLLNVHNRTLHGLFLARVPPVRDLIPGLFPAMGPQRRTFPFHTQVMCVVEAEPLQNEEFAPLLGQRPVPGPLSATAVFNVAALIFSRMPAPAVLRIAGMLRQMEKVGMPITGLLNVPEGVVPAAAEVADVPVASS